MECILLGGGEETGKPARLMSTGIRYLDDQKLMDQADRDVDGRCCLRIFFLTDAAGVHRVIEQIKKDDAQIIRRDVAVSGKFYVIVIVQDDTDPIKILASLVFSGISILF